VLVLEYMPGIRIADKERLQAAGISTDLVAQRATEAYLQQILRHGFFHADPRKYGGAGPVVLRGKATVPAALVCAVCARCLWYTG
jgi:hypothetical protein